MRRDSFLLSGAGALLAGCAAGVSAPVPGAVVAAGAARKAHAPFTLGYIGQLLLVPYYFVPEGWALCDGSMLPIGDFTALYSLLGTRFGGNGNTTFGIPDLRGHEPLKGLRYVIALYGDYPGNDHFAFRYYGELMLVPYDITPRGWAACDGALLSVNNNVVLYSLLGTQFGGDGIKSFALPDTRKHVPALGLKYIISLNGFYPARGGYRGERPETDVYAGELLLVPYYTPAGWLPCNGGLQQINTNQALFSLVGTQFGGNGTSTFAMPDMRDHVPIEHLTYVMAMPGVYPPRG